MKGGHHGGGGCMCGLRQQRSAPDVPCPCPATLQAVYHMPTSEDADPATSMPLALQSVFYKVPCLRLRLCLCL